MRSRDLMTGRWSVRAGLLLLAFAAFMPLVLLALYVGRYQTGRQRQDTEAAVTAVSRTVAGDLGAAVTDAGQLAQTLAARPAVVAMDPVRCDPLLAEVVTLEPRVRAVRAISPTGMTVCQAGAPVAGAVPAETLHGDGAAIGEAIYWPVAGAWSAELGVPIYGSDGASRGMLVLTLGLAHLQEHLARLQLSPGSVALLYDQHGSVLAGSTAAERWAGARVTDLPQGGRLLNQRRGVLTVTGQDGERQIAGLHPVPGTGWTVLLGMPERRVTAQAWETLQYGGLAGAALLAALALAVYLVNARIARPLRALAGTSLAVAGGDTQIRATTGGPREIADAALALNTLLDAQAQSTDRLARSEAVYRAITEHFPSGAVILFDQGQRCLAAGGEALAALDLAPAAMVGQPLDTFLPPGLKAEAAPWWQEVLAGQSFSRPGSYRGRWYDVHLHPVRDADGTVRAGLLVGMDVTDRRRTEEEREALQARTAEAQAAAAAERLRTEIVNTISHELRTPLGAIKGYTSTLLAFGDVVSPLERVEFLQEIEAAAGRLTGLVDSLVAAAAIEHDLAPAGRDVISVVEVAPAALEAVSRRFRGRAFVIEQRTTPPPIRAAAGRLAQALEVLLENAARYSPPAAPVVLRVDATAAGEAALRVIDRGDGIPPEEHQRIFDRFYRGASRLEGSQRGAGMGLAICRRIVEQEGGRITLESAPGQGSTFSIIMPPAASAVPAAPPVESAAGG